MIFAIFFSTICEVFFEERFDRGWERRWVKSEKHPPGKPFGRWQITSGSTPGDPNIQRGIKTLDNYKHYCISARFQKCWGKNEKDHELIVQYTNKQDKPVICGGLYLKLFPDGFDQKRFTGGTPYSLMFGPDICHAHTHNIKLLINRNGTNFNMNANLDPDRDGHTHLFTLRLFGDGSFTIYKDGNEIHHSTFKEDFDYEGPKYILDPYDRKPSDWDDREWVIDQEDKKPDNWDDRKLIPDTNAEKPSLWNDEIDGTWTPPMIPNPHYMGIWKPREVQNPNYMGIWRPRKILNPDYSPDEDFGKFDDLCYLGIDILQDNAGTIFDNFLVTDNFTYAQEMAKEVYFDVKPLEDKVFERWGGNDRWEKQRDWGIMDVGRSKQFTRDANGNTFGDKDGIYSETHKKKIDNNVVRSLDSRGFRERDDL
ncbi:Calreticulin family protein [Histomonas meleagridis]|uniref:Calreticulin family protein n=1 Tax=Histomonas meleagridis TaxID=135588 RepID=UPI003559823E|nr:Calreticulin family protein [Histomonas meleagridis]KAH0798169.1 Calreticulin family protein [Histomonas meleagridis]